MAVHATPSDAVPLNHTLHMMAAAVLSRCCGRGCDDVSSIILPRQEEQTPYPHRQRYYDMFTTKAIAWSPPATKRVVAEENHNSKTERPGV
jgi:hypothetical protein